MFLLNGVQACGVAASRSWPAAAAGVGLPLSLAGLGSAVTARPAAPHSPLSSCLSALRGLSSGVLAWVTACPGESWSHSTLSRGRGFSYYKVSSYLSC